jgi:hypothetical protein
MEGERGRKREGQWRRREREKGKKRERAEKGPIKL